MSHYVKHLGGEEVDGDGFLGREAFYVECGRKYKGLAPL
jgi:hypothetical protein